MVLVDPVVYRSPDRSMARYEAVLEWSREPHVSMPCPPSTSAASACAGIRPQVLPAPGLSVQALRGLSTIPNQGCSQVFGDNVSASRQMLDRMSPHELRALLEILVKDWVLDRDSLSLKGWVSHHLKGMCQPL